MSFSYFSLFLSFIPSYLPFFFYTFFFLPSSIYLFFSLYFLCSTFSFSYHTPSLHPSPSLFSSIPLFRERERERTPIISLLLEPCDQRFLFWSCMCFRISFIYSWQSAAGQKLNWATHISLASFRNTSSSPSWVITRQGRISKTNFFKAWTSLYICDNTANAHKTLNSKSF